MRHALRPCASQACLAQDASELRQRPSQACLPCTELMHIPGQVSGRCLKQIVLNPLTGTGPQRVTYSLRQCPISKVLLSQCFTKPDLTWQVSFVTSPMRSQHHLCEAEIQVQHYEFFP